MFFVKWRQQQKWQHQINRQLKKQFNSFRLRCENKNRFWTDRFHRCMQFHQIEWRRHCTRGKAEKHMRCNKILQCPQDIKRRIVRTSTKCLERNVEWRLEEERNATETTEKRQTKDIDAKEEEKNRAKADFVQFRQRINERFTIKRWKAV